MPTRSQLRRLAAYVLLVWLFGLGSGIVNACIVKAQLADAGQAMVHAGHDHAAMSSDSGGHDHETHHTKPPCERLCDGPPAAPQADHQQANPLSGLWLAAAPPPSSQFQVLAGLRENRIGTDAQSRASIPISIAFLRLTL
jgi:hypothetical protein